MKLTGLLVVRGYAAFGVVLFHLLDFVPLDKGALREMLGALQLLLPVFFALSAFSLLYGYGVRLFDQRVMARFFIRRAFRILPLFYVMLLLWLLKTWSDGAPLPSRSEIVLNMALLFNLLPGKQSSIVYGGWLLGTEWLFYAIFPLFALLAQRVASSFAALVAGVGIAVAFSGIFWELGYADPSFRNTSILRALVFFQIGATVYALAGALRLKPNQNGPGGRTVAGLVIVVTLALLLMVGRGVPSATATFDLLIGLVCSTWVLSGYLGLPRWFDNAPARYLGRLSYGLYLVHPLVMALLDKAGVYRAIIGHAGSPQIGYLLSLIVSLAIALLFAEAVFRAIEVPGIRLGEWLVQRANLKSPASASASG